MAVSIEQRAAQMVNQLGAPQGPILVRTELDQAGKSHTIRTQYFYNGVLNEFDGDCWAMSEATIADSFLSRPA